MSLIGFEHHNHASCIESAVAAAEGYCAENGLQFTPVRQRVLELLLAQHRAMGAYEILDVLREEGLGAQPPVAYRALDFLVRHGFAHRVEKLNAFTACAHPGETHSPVFLICRACNTVAEAQAQGATGMLASAARDSGFRVDRAVVEAEGVCARCREGHAG
ncbi:MULTISPECIES: transcriptional repressor [unclassified Rhodosalinus]|uniref:transcriptional repressor n=1 Tax=unclassified Rhodosalinus TaxID=2630183 RepID=UPI0035268916